MAVPNWKLPYLVESSGAVIVGEESCIGERNTRDLTDEAPADLDGMLDAQAGGRNSLTLSLPRFRPIPPAPTTDDGADVFPPCLTTAAASALPALGRQGGDDCPSGI